MDVPLAAYTLPAPSAVTAAGALPFKSALVVGATGVVLLFAVVDALSKASTEPEMFPPSAILALPEEFDTVSVAERNPTAEGVFVTVTVQSTVLSPLSVQAGEPAVMSGVELNDAVDAADAPP
jgi:hypothetical protein